jgi:acetyltransferase-like isoleucine patch superfamily enzyme
VTTGEWAPGKLILFELITGCFSGMPGACGLFFRRICYRMLFKKMGRNVTIGKNVTLRGCSRVVLGNNVCIDDNCVIDARGSGSSIFIGENVFIGRNTIIRSREGQLSIDAGSDIGCNCIIATDSQLKIGKDVLIAGYVYVSAGGTHRFDDPKVPIIKQGFIRKGGSIIEDDVWIGAYSMVLDGVTIGRGSVIGAFSLVNHSIPPMSVAYGIPATVRRTRGGGS